METNNKSFNNEWKMRSEELFTVFRNMILPNPRTGNLEIRNEGENWNTLVKTIFSVAHGKGTCLFNSSNAATGLKPLIPYAGGKTNELKYIYPSLPSYDRFFEPFVGGGSVFMGINANEYFINDFSSELMGLYKNIAGFDDNFFRYADLIDQTIKNAIKFRDEKEDILFGIYNRYREDSLSDKSLKTEITAFCKTHKSEILAIVEVFSTLPCTLIDEMEKFLFLTIKSLYKKDEVSSRKKSEYLLSAVQKALFTHYRNLYNIPTLKETNPSFYAALFLYIRERAFRSGFNYNKKGELNSTYDGFGKNYKLMADRIEYYRSKSVREHFNNTHIFNLDFEKFLKETRPSKDDFIFLDPPYDETFSSYHGNEFNRYDHQRLTNYLLNECQAKWMMIIKKTDFIYNLYNQEGIYINTYDKVYTCNNVKGAQTTHLMITNYPVSLETKTLLRAA